MVQFNPLGEQGVACLLRMICRSHMLEWCDLSNFRQAAHVKRPFNAGDPTGLYQLQMKKAVDRSTPRAASIVLLSSEKNFTPLKNFCLFLFSLRVSYSPGHNQCP